LRELLDGVAAVAEDPLVAVDVGDGAATGRRIHERRVVGHQPEIVVRGFHLPKIGGTDGPVLNRELVALAGAVVDDRERVLRHSGSLELGKRKDNASSRPLPSLTVALSWQPWHSPVPASIPRARAPAHCSASNSAPAAISPAFCWGSRRKASKSRPMPRRRWARSSTSLSRPSSSSAPTWRPSGQWPSR